MLVELAVGDAYGSGFEYAPEEFVRAHNDLAAYRQHPRHGIRPGCYTDNTQMSLAVAEAIVADEPWTPERLADRFVTAFRRDPREGYAGKFYQLLPAPLLAGLENGPYGRDYLSALDRQLLSRVI